MIKLSDSTSYNWLLVSCNWLLVVVGCLVVGHTAYTLFLSQSQFEAEIDSTLVPVVKVSSEFAGDANPATINPGDSSDRLEPSLEGRASIQSDSRLGA